MLEALAALWDRYVASSAVAIDHRAVCDAFRHVKYIDHPQATDGWNGRPARSRSAFRSAKITRFLRAFSLYSPHSKYYVQQGLRCNAILRVQDRTARRAAALAVCPKPCHLIFKLPTEAFRLFQRRQVLEETTNAPVHFRAISTATFPTVKETAAVQVWTTM